MNLICFFGIGSRMSYFLCRQKGVVGHERQFPESYNRYIETKCHIFSTLKVLDLKCHIF